MMKNFTYHAPQTISAALMLLDQALARGEDTYLLAGGTVLVPQIKESLIRPSLVISLKHLPRLKKITLDEKGLHLGPLITPVELIRSPLILEHYPVLAQAAATMAGVQIRNMATIGGNLCSAVPTADLVPSLLALATIVQVQGPNGLRSVPVEHFFTAPGQTILRPDELVTGLTIPRPAGPTTAVYIKHAQPKAMAIAIVGVAAALQRHNGTCEEIRIGLGGVAPTPIRALRAEVVLRSQTLTDENIAATARLAAEESQPEDDVRASAWYRRRMVEVLIRRALYHLRDDAMLPAA